MLDEINKRIHLKFKPPSIPLKKIQQTPSHASQSKIASLTTPMSKLVSPVNSLYFVEDFGQTPKYTLDFLLKDDLEANNLPKDYVEL